MSDWKYASPGPGPRDLFSGRAPSPDDAVIGLGQRRFRRAVPPVAAASPRGGVSFGGIHRSKGVKRFTSSRSLFGLPLFDIVIPGPVPPGSTPERPVARGWLAIGPVAVGLGSFGALSIGGLALGGLALGSCPLGGVAVGAIALGGAAIGYWAVGGAAIAVHAALGGLAAALTYAQGGAAFAEHANDAAAREFFSSGFILPALRHVAGHSSWFLLLLFVLALIPLFSKRSSGA